jgi:hypothetical protein
VRWKVSWNLRVLLDDAMTRQKASKWFSERVGDVPLICTVRLDEKW